MGDLDPVAPHISGEPLSQVLCDRQERQVFLGDEVVRYSDPDLNKQDSPRGKWCEFIWRFPARPGGTPTAGWFIRDNSINMNDLGVPPFIETPRWRHVYV